MIIRRRRWLRITRADRRAIAEARKHPERIPTARYAKGPDGHWRRVETDRSEGDS